MFANANCYGILGVSENASQDDPKKSYGKAAIMNHPDESGDPEEPEEFKELGHAYEVPSDLVLPCGVYDHYSEDALKDGMSGGVGRAREQNALIPLSVSLECMYNGAYLKQRVSRYALCSKCKGTGETFHDKGCCQQCGEKVGMEEKLCVVYVEKGMENGQIIIFPGVDHNTGGFVFILQEKEHPKFQRIGNDLLVEHTLSPGEAMCGYEFELIHLDNRQLIIESPPGEIVRPGEVIEINGEGMPMYQRPFMRGKLYIRFAVQAMANEAALPPICSQQLTDMEVETATSARGI